MNIGKFLINADADEPTVGLRGVAALACAGAAPFFIDWRTMALPLAVAVLGGVAVGLGCVRDAVRQLGPTDDRKAWRFWISWTRSRNT